MKHDGRLAGQLMLDQNLKSKYTTVSMLNEKQRERNKEQFCGGLQQMIDDAENELFFDNFAKYVNRICDLARTSRVKLDSNYFQVAMALKIVEGVALSLNRDLDLITKCLPIVVKAQAMKKLGRLCFRLFLGYFLGFIISSSNVFILYSIIVILSRTRLLYIHIPIRFFSLIDSSYILFFIQMCT